MSRSRPLRLNLASEVALAAVSIATAVAFSRIFEDATFLPPIAAAAAASAAISAATRRAGWGVGRAALTSVAGLALAISWFVYPGTTALGVPTPTTLDTLRADAGEAWRTFQDVVAPAPVEPGFVVALVVALWISAFLADWAAFRLWSPVEAVVPSCALFLFASLLGAEQDEVLVTAVFVAALLAFQLIHHIAKEFGSRHWINADADQGGRRLVLAGAGMGAVALCTAVVAGPLLPGADSAAVVEWRDLGDDSPARVTVSPMVSIHSQLVLQPDAELFIVEASRPAYWRLTGLDTFDGEIWKSSGSFEDVSDVLPRLGPDLPEVDRITQRFEIEQLGQLWLPAAFEPTRIEASDAEVVYEAETSTLIVSNERSNSDDLTYVVESIDPTLDTELLNQPGDVPREIAERFLGLPDDFSPTLTQVAREVTAAGSTDYEKARLLQDWFRREFTYNLDVDLRQDIDSIERFLEVREGYCQQFAGTYAAFARALGIPARVAVGFTWGDPDPDDPTRYHVRGRNAHAWPEVWLPGPGWVPFEPTPGRGNPQATDVTGLDPQQEPPPEGEGPAPSTTPTTAGSSPTTPTTAPPAIPEPELETGGPGTGADAEPAGPAIMARLAVPSAVVVGAGLAYVVVVLLAGQAQRRRERERVLTEAGRATADGRPGPAQRARLAWHHALERLEVAGLRRGPAETPHEFVTRVRACTDLDAGALEHLAAVETAATYGAREPAERAVVRAEQAAQEVATWVRHHTSWWERLRWALDPRPLLPRRQRIVATGASAPAGG